MIHSISSNLVGFKSVKFGPGLNVLLAQKSEGATEKHTRNSAGKTSLIELIHYLTGNAPDKDSVIRAKALEDYRFSMEFDLAGSQVAVTRATGKASKIEVSGLKGSRIDRSLPNTEWVEILGEKMFHLYPKDTGPKPPTFRSLFAYFVRRQQSDAFTEPDKQAAQQQAWDSQLSLMYLMGFDWEIARDWQQVREREGTLKELKKAAGLGTFGGIIGKASDLRTQLTVAEDRLKKLREDVDVFQVLAQYRDYEREANQITSELQALTNGNVVDEATVQELELALASEAVPSLLNLDALYKEASVVLPEMVKKRYDDVRSFHESVVRNRHDYITGELAVAKERIASRNLKKVALNSRRAVVMNILQSHGALDEFNKLQAEAGRLGAQVESLRSRFAAAQQLEGTKNELELERSQLELRLRKDFTEQNQRLSDAILAFQNISGRLYENAGNMNIDITRKGPLFQFSTPGDRGTGIQKMQIFCFDMMLMSLCVKRGFGPGFLIHDSHLFDGVDGRQFINAMRVGAETAKELGFQYIVTMNEDDAFKEKESGFDLNDYVKARLTDATIDGGLFGIRFD